MGLAPGQIVNVTGYLMTIHSGNKTSVYSSRYHKPRQAMLLGKSCRYTGEVRGYYEDGRYLVRNESHRVWMVMPLSGSRYRKPIAVLEEHIEEGATQ